MDPPDLAELKVSKHKGTFEDLTFWPGFQRNLDQKVENYLRSSYKQDPNLIVSNSDRYSEEDELCSDLIIDGLDNRKSSYPDTIDMSN